MLVRMHTDQGFPAVRPGDYIAGTHARHDVGRSAADASVGRREGP
jgi:hypothetical protein